MNLECRELRLRQRIQKLFSLQASMAGALHMSCTSPKQEWFLLRPDVRVDKKEKTSTSEQAAAREEFARPPKKRQQQRMTAWTTVPSHVSLPILYTQG